MASDQSILALIGTDSDPNVVAPSRAIDAQHPTIIGPGLSGPRNAQQLTVQRDTRPLAFDELAFQRSLGMEVFARNPAGRYMVFYENTAAGGGLSSRLPGLPLQQGQRPSPVGPAQLAGNFGGIQAPVVLPAARTVYYTASPGVGYGVYGDW